jgi:hypothetical protein
MGLGFQGVIDEGFDSVSITDGGNNDELPPIAVLLTTSGTGTTRQRKRMQASRNWSNTSLMRCRLFVSYTGISKDA